MAMTELLSFGAQNDLSLPTPPSASPPSFQSTPPPGLVPHRDGDLGLRPEIRTGTKGNGREGTMTPTHRLDRDDSHHLL